MQQAIADGDSSPLSSIDERFKLSSPPSLTKSSSGLLRDETLPDHTAAGEEDQNTQPTVDKQPQEVEASEIPEGRNDGSGGSSKSPSDPTPPSTHSDGVSSQTTHPAPRPKAQQTTQQAKKPSAQRRLKKPRWDAETIITDPRSPLAKADLRVILCSPHDAPDQANELQSLLSNPKAWDCLDAIEKAEIVALFPDQEAVIHRESGEARPDFSVLRNDNTFRLDCATYVDNVAQGRFDPDWLTSAWAAHERRKIGDFDQYLIDKFEEDWATELPDEFKPVRAQQSQHAITEAAAGNGDDTNGHNDDGKDGAESLKRKSPGIGGDDSPKKAKGPNGEAARPNIVDSTEDQVMSEEQDAQSSARNSAAPEQDNQKKTRRAFRNSLAQRQNHGMDVDDEDELA
ncbi:Asx homology domain-containing protein [Emericellopsis atlantica]|uniref:Asx homology domain-containing protein n=1 Tax=Emericellopsis atlantica TaxID=2614577 RepID=A0A9P7ZIP7_9HYPO|nr:Asx homology domain-containing protein [Emericellopsis atlantica]KAG9252320.1 Asx homology domain-containing protein [Emericellopsis atlantica]